MGIYNVYQTFKCGVCQKDIEEHEIIYQDVTHFRVVCSTCNDLFTKEDLELVINIFLSHEGFFGKLKPTASKHDLKGLIIEYEKRSKLNVEEMNILLLHKALLYEITPKQFIKQLTSFALLVLLFDQKNYNYVYLSF